MGNMSNNKSYKLWDITDITVYWKSMLRLYRLKNNYINEIVEQLIDLIWMKEKERTGTKRTTP